MPEITLAVTQMAMSASQATNLDRAEDLVRQAAAQGAGLVLLPELFAGPYFCQVEDPAKFFLAEPAAGNPIVARFARLARELGVVLPISFFERSGQRYFNSLAMVDADGQVLGIYRKSHIPCGPGYQEKYYFAPGNTGFRVWSTAVGVVGAGICWDQWFPEAARAMALMGAEILVYPSAIGSEPPEPQTDSRDLWRRVMQGHAAANLMPLVAANRVGTEHCATSQVRFYGSGFITDHTGELLTELDREEEGVALATVDLKVAEAFRADWGFFRDRRPEFYGIIAGEEKP